MMNDFLNTLVLSGLISTALFGLFSVSYAEDLAQVEIDIKNSNGDRTGASNVVFKVYQYAKDTLYTELKPKSDYPYFVASLPVDHKYRLDGFVNGMFAGSSIINIKNNYEQILEPNLATDNLELDSLEENISEITSCNCVAFRLDDIQDYWINDVQIEIMEIFNEQDIPLTIGIIGSEIGEDTQIVSYINQSIPSNLLEIANHGWKHEDFTEYDKETQSQLIKNTNEQLQNIFGVTPTVFIPPYNEYNNDTISAMNENGIIHFSSSTNIANPPYPMMDAQLYSFPAGASTGELYLENSLFTGINHKLTLSQIQKSISQYGFAVIMMHPQDFSVIEGEEHLNQINWNQIRELELLLDRLKIAELDIVPISKIDFDLDDTPKLPPWAQQISQWWSEGKISDEEYAFGIKFYQANDIISI